jgi:uncharacterized phosphosugar-binding protein
MSAQQYISEIKHLIDYIEISQMENIQRVADLVADAILQERLVYIFGAGHSNLMACECFARAGGLANIQPILDPGLDFYAGAARQSGFERLPGYVHCLIQDYDIQPGDVVIIVSNSGRNPAPVQMALEVKKLGAIVVALTSMAHSASVTSKDPSGKRLFEIADIVLDNGCLPGDALVQLPELRPRVGPGSTVMGAMILNAIIVQASRNVLDRNGLPPVGMSGNLEGGKEYNEKIAEIRNKFSRKMRHR